MALASGDALARVIAFGAGVYVARTLGPAMYGVVGFASAVVLYFFHLAGCGIDLTEVRDVARDPERVRDVAPDLLTARLLISLGLCALLFTGAWTLLPSPEAEVLALYSLTLIAVGPNPKFVWLGLARSKPVAVARTVGELLFLLTVLWRVRTSTDLVFVPWAQFLGDALAAAVMLVWLKRSGMRFSLRVRWSVVAPILRRSFPLVVNVIVGLMIYNSDLLFLWFFQGQESVGHYNAAYQLISFLINMASAFAFSLLPALSAASGDRAERDRIYGLSQAQVFAVGLPVAVGGALVAERIIEIIFEVEFVAAGPALAVLVSSVPLFLFRDVGSMALIVAGREKLVMRITGLSLVCNLALNAYVIPRYGIVGAAATTLFTEVVRTLLTALATRREGWPSVAPRRLWRPLVGAAAMAAALLATPDLGLVPALALGAATYTAVLGAVGGIALRRGAFPTLRV